MSRRLACVLVAGLLFGPGCPVAQDDLPGQARATLKRATEYFTSKVATQGGYLWEYTKDLKQRWGEGSATDTQVWVQPPGTPSVGMAYLRAYEVTNDPLYLEAARKAADALCWGQLSSGGWDYKIEFDPENSKAWHYRRDVEAGDKDPGKRRVTSTFDDNTTQSAMRLLMAVDKATNGAEPYRKAAEYGLAFMLRSQFKNGAWPQRYPLAETGYSRFYTFNDNAMNDCIYVMLMAYKTYGKQEHLDSAKRGGDFIILSQLPAPQAGWAQQYDSDLKPAWARWFEPPACCSAVTSRNIKTLVDLYLETSEEKYLKPIPAAIDWLNRSKFEDNTWARFYELETNKPIYVNLDQKVVYEFVNIRPGYSWRGSYGVESNVAYYNKVKELGRDKYVAQRDRVLTKEEYAARAKGLESTVRKIIADLDAEGRWLDGDRIKCSTFIANLQRLCDYLEAVSRSA